MAARRAGGRACRSIRTARSHDNTARAQRFARQLRGRFKLPVYEVDERYSTTEALAARRGAMPDAGAACVILEQFLQEPCLERHRAASLALDAEALYRELLRGVQQPARARTPRWSASTSGGAWLAERLQQRPAACRASPASSPSAMHRDDFAKRGLPARGQQTQLPFDVERRAHRAGRRRALHRPHHPRGDQRTVRLRPPASVKLAVLVDRGGRELPIAGRLRGGARRAAAPTQSLALARDDDGRFSFDVEGATLMLYKRNPQLNKQRRAACTC